MTPREGDPNGANSGGGEAGYDERPDHDRRTAGVDETEREVITSGTAATSEVADRDAQEDAEGRGDGPPLPG
jgi:hypothetical protein